ncbi:MAG: recombinase family protein [Lentisphaerae bacterium]|jgi:DNA invertase Pin-like site-specific DNA recombinase|nr:recombinase family protein [Lentisphaerota bacterium]MBT5607339.1 recombinase family protein [Lentisphaerota bacterium]MBT7844573.1 recombinase family protein [Lentisphaerota bacterium]
MNEKTAKAAVIYARTSSDDPKDKNKRSAQQQVEQCQQLAAGNGYSVVGVYIDRDTTGALWPDVPGAAVDAVTTAKYGDRRRAGFTSVVELLQSGQATTLLVWNTTRIARPISSTFRGWVIDFFQTTGAMIDTTEKGLVDLSNLSDELMLTIEQTMNRRELDANTRKSMNARADLKVEGKLIGSPCLGYESMGKQRVIIEEEEAKTVRMIFELWALKQYGYRKTMRALIEAERKTKYGGNWHSNTIGAILANPAYIGKFRKTDGTLIDSPIYDRIVSDRLWYGAQTIRRKMPTTGNKSRNQPDRLTGGLAVCGNCGRNLRVTETMFKLASGEQYRDQHYGCYNIECNSRGRVSRKQLDELVSMLIDTSDETQTMIETVKISNETYDKWQNKLNALDAERTKLNDIRGEYLTDTDLLLSKSDLAAALKAIDAKVSTVTAEIDSISEKITALKPDKADWKAYASWLFERIEVHKASHVDLYVMPNIAIRVPMRVVERNRRHIMPLSETSIAKLAGFKTQSVQWAGSINFHLPEAPVRFYSL